MSWFITCTDRNCKQQTRARNIVDLIERHRDTQGWLLCKCGRHGYIEKSFRLQEGELFKPALWGIITLGDSGKVYQPFVFLLSDDVNEQPDQVWFSYYKDLRPTGRLKLGYGPGGPPVAGKAELLKLIHELVGQGLLTRVEVEQALGQRFAHLSSADNPSKTDTLGCTPGLTP